MLEMKLLKKRCGKINHLSIDDYIQTDGYKNLEKAFTMERYAIIEEVEKSYLRGRGGAGFPTSIKMVSLAKESDLTKYIICNADEGEPGNFKDRFLMENDPHQIIEGMIIVAYATRASKGYIYSR